MSNDLEERLREALRPADPGEDFTTRVLARVAAGEHGEAAGRSAARPAWRRLTWGRLALAASLAAAVLIGIGWRQRELEGRAARAQLIQALRVTSQKLDLAYRLVNSPPSSGTADDPDTHSS